MCDVARVQCIKSKSRLAVFLPTFSPQSRSNLPRKAFSLWHSQQQALRKSLGLACTTHNLRNMAMLRTCDNSGRPRHDKLDQPRFQRSLLHAGRSMTREPVGAEAPLQAGEGISGVAFTSSKRLVASQSIEAAAPIKTLADVKAARSAQATDPHKEIAPGTVNTSEASPEDFTAAARAAARAAFPQEAEALEQEELDLEQDAVSNHKQQPPALEHMHAAGFLVLCITSPVSHSKRLCPKAVAP